MAFRSALARGIGAVKRLTGSAGGRLSGLKRLTGSAGGRLSGFVARAASRRPVIIGAAVVLVVALVGSGIAAVSFVALSPAATPSPTAAPTEVAIAPTDTPIPTLEATLEPTPTLAPTATPAPTSAPMVAATTDGVWLPADQAELATRKPIAVMIDDQMLARPQSGLSMANIVYQGPAEGGIPRYMALFQTQAPLAIGPIRSCRAYFVAWAEEWRAGYVHMWGAPNAMAKLAADNGKYIYNMDGLRFGGKSGYMWRTVFRERPHNLYTSYAKIYSLLRQVGGTAPLSTPLFTFADALPPSARPMGSSIIVPYDANNVVYNYDWKTNTYPRSVSSEGPQYDAATGKRIAPSNVILLYMNAGLLAGSPAALTKHRLDVQYVGHGAAWVFNNGLTIQAVWTKKNEHATTVLTYASGPNRGQQVPLVRGQIFIQVVPNIAVTPSWQTGYAVPPEIINQGS
jgi:hypothetical protein